jgi:GDP-L-fucose synthase
MTSEKPASFLVPTVLVNTNVLEACRINEVGGVLFTSSIGVYAPAPLMREDDLWNSVPSNFDIHAGYAKRLGELQIDAYKRQFSLEGMQVVRPANVYGPFDNFDVETAMVIPSLVSKVLKAGNTLEVWGDGTPVRDFIHARDVAIGMMRVVESGIDKPVNLGSGRGVSIRELVEIFQQILPGLAVEWKDLPGDSPVHGDNVRVLDVERANSIGFSASISLLDGIKETLEWCRVNSSTDGSAGRYSAFA